ncbi:hypothetical protein CRE_28809 [Caenorhabditis remanei]|uniref:Retrotransposon gag domain-containing protein n=1 Tax=Caenorhabditis remanei TaxID=31234 RepID=E3MK74_CAERE|nr:hypothetical protein CRE_28809 [Caenorhabditis remanei]
MEDKIFEQTPILSRREGPTGSPQPTHKVRDFFARFLSFFDNSEEDPQDQTSGKPTENEQEEVLTPNPSDLKEKNPTPNSTPPGKPGKEEKSFTRKPEKPDMEKKELAGDLQWEEDSPAETEPLKALRAVAGHVPKFSKGNTAALRRWLVDYRLALHNLNIKQEAGARILPFFLDGLAKQRYHQLPAAQKATWTDVVENLIRAFEVPGDRELAQQEITTLKQGELTITEYARRLRTLGEYAYEGMPENVRESLLLNHFMHHAAPHLRKKLLQMENVPKTLEEMIRKAERFQRLHNLDEEKEDEQLVAAMSQLMRPAPDQDREMTGRPSYRQPSAPPLESGTQPSWRYGGRDPPNYRNGGRPNFQRNDRQNFRPNFRQNDRPNYRQDNRPPMRGRGPPLQYQPNRFPMEPPRGRFPMESPLNRFRPEQPPGRNYRNEERSQDERNFHRGRGFPNKLLAYLTISMMLVGLAQAGKPQICGFQQGGNMFVPPSVLPCEPPKTPIIATKADIFELRSDPMRQIAHSCYKQTFQVQTFSFLKFYVTAKMTNPGENVFQSVRVQECREAVRLKKFAGKDLIESPKGVFRSAHASEVAENHTAWFGSTHFNHEEIIIVVGEVASFDGATTISTLGDTSKCLYSSGYCKTEKTTIVWMESAPFQSCKYQRMTSADAFISDKHIAIPELRMFAAISQDMRFTDTEAKGCTVGNVYFTDDGKMISFPELPSDLWIPDYVRMKEGHHRRKRTLLLVPGPNNITMALNLGEKFAVPIIQRLFSVDALEKIERFETEPISDPRILNEIKTFGVTNELLMTRAERYESERKNSLGHQLIVLKCIRIMQYKFRTTERLNNLKRELTAAESELLKIMSSDLVNVFDPLLDLEFGVSEETDSTPHAGYKFPRFDEDKVLKMEYRTPYIEVEYVPPTIRTVTIAPTTTTTQQPTVAVPRTVAPTRAQVPNPPEPTNPPKTTTPKPQTPRTTPAITSPPKPTPPRLPPVTTPSTTTTTTNLPQVQTWEEYIPESNRNVVFEKPQERPFHSPAIDLFMNTCIQQREATILFQTVLNIDPTAAVRQLMKRTDIAARKAGQGILVTQCKTVEPEEIIWDRKINNTCFDLVPMMIDGKIWFLLEGTDDLVAESGSVECTTPQETGKIHKEDLVWRNEKGSETWVQTFNRPIRREANQFLFQTPTVVGKDLLGPGTSSAADEELSKMYRQKVNNIAFKLLEENVVKAKDFITNTVKVHKDRVANTLESIWNQAGKRVFETVKTVVFDVTKFLLIIIVPLAVIVILVIILYAYCKYKLARKAATVTARQMIEMATKQLRSVNYVDQTPTRKCYVATNIEDEYPIPGVYSVLHHHNKGHLPVIQVEMDGRTLHALIDTGAGVSYLPESMVPPEQIESGKQIANAANGSVIKFIGSTQQKIRIGDIVVDQLLLVSVNGDCPSEMVLGIDFVRNLNRQGYPINFDMVNKKLTIGKEVALICSVPIKHQIDSGKDVKSPASRIHGIPPEVRQEIEKQIKKMGKQGTICELLSSLGTPVILVRKAKEKSRRFRINGSELNNITKTIRSVHPNLQELLEVTAENPIHNTRDFSSSSYQIEERNKQYTNKANIDDVQFEDGNKILLRKGSKDKLSPHFLCPLEVIKTEDPNITIKGFGRVTRNGDKRETEVHKDSYNKVIESE